jgi:7-cyano-7-deazaguanine synthase
MSDKCVVLLSGGMDSAVLMYSLIESYEVWPLTLSYGQKHNKEIVAARNLCEARGNWLLTRWKYADLGVLRYLLPSTLTGKGDVPKGFYADVNMKQTVVPNRNMILLSIAAGYAVGIGAKYVAYGAHQGDHAIYPDCRPAFISSIANTIRLGTGWENDGVELITPFTKMGKGEIASLGLRLVVPFKLSWTCYEGDERPCLKCGSCTERTDAFLKAGHKDPLLTSEEWDDAVRYLKGVCESDVR